MAGKPTSTFGPPGLAAALLFLALAAGAAAASEKKASPDDVTVSMQCVTNEKQQCDSKSLKHLADSKPEAAGVIAVARVHNQSSIDITSPKSAAITPQDYCGWTKNYKFYVPSNTYTCGNYGAYHTYYKAVVYSDYCNWYTGGHRGRSTGTLTIRSGCYFTSCYYSIYNKYMALQCYYCC